MVSFTGVENPSHAHIDLLWGNNCPTNIPMNFIQEFPLYKLVSHSHSNAFCLHGKRHKVRYRWTTTFSRPANRSKLPGCLFEEGHLIGFLVSNQAYHSPILRFTCRVRAIFVWSWNENAPTKQKQQTNGNRAIWLVCWTDTNARGVWLVKRTFGWKKLHARKLSRNQSILRFEVILQHHWPIEQCLLHFRFFFSRENEESMFWFFIHWLIKQITNTYRNHFSRS